MKKILLKTLYSLIISYVIFNIITLVNGYFNPLHSFVLLLFLHALIFLIGLIELKIKSNLKLRIVPHLILAVLFFIWTWISPESNDGNDFYLAPLVSGIAQIMITGLELKNNTLIKIFTTNINITIVSIHCKTS